MKHGTLETRLRNVECLIDDDVTTENEDDLEFLLRHDDIEELRSLIDDAFVDVGERLDFMVLSAARGARTKQEWRLFRTRLKRFVELVSQLEREITACRLYRNCG